MMAVAFANILSRWITHEGKKPLYLKPRIRIVWPYWIAAWINPGDNDNFGSCYLLRSYSTIFRYISKISDELDESSFFTIKAG
jgi:hypothetical protein